jgi:outer membrane protein
MFRKFILFIFALQNEKQINFLHMKLFTSISFIALIFSLSLPVSSQTVHSFTLKEAIDYAMQNNYDVIYSEMNIAAAKQQMKVATAYGLPQLSGAVDYADNLEIPTTLLPGEFVGQPGTEVPIQFGTQYSMTAGLFASQLIFSGKYIVGLQTAKLFMEKADVDFFKDKVAITQQVADSYFNVLSTQEALSVIDSTLQVTSKLARETREIFEVGFAEDIDVDQLELLVSDLQANQIYFQNQLHITNSYLKFYLGIDSQDSIILTDDVNSLIEGRLSETLGTQKFDYNQNVDYVSLEKQKEIRMMQVKLARTEYMPTLAANINLKTNAQRNVWNFASPDERWYASSVFGVSLQVPLWSSGERGAKVKQAQIAFDQIEVKQDQLINSLNLQYDAALNEYFNAFAVFQNKEKAKLVAERIFMKTSVKFTEGMASSLDILNTQTQFLRSEQDFINASLALLKAGQELDKLLTKSVNN